jgi:hypothetical protein
MAVRCSDLLRTLLLLARTAGVFGLLLPDWTRLGARRGRRLGNGVGLRTLLLGLRPCLLLQGGLVLRRGLHLGLTRLVGRGLGLLPFGGLLGSLGSGLLLSRRLLSDAGLVGRGLRLLPFGGLLSSLGSGLLLSRPLGDAGLIGGGQRLLPLGGLLSRLSARLLLRRRLLADPRLVSCVQGSLSLGGALRGLRARLLLRGGLLGDARLVGGV